MFCKNRILGKFLISLLLICVISHLTALSVLAQSDDIDIRIKRQMRRINFGEQTRTLTTQQAKQLKDSLNGIALQAEAARKKNNGQLTASQITKFDNDLNQNFDNIQTHLGAGKKVKTAGNVLGPRWAAGTDGAQDPRQLRRQMKLQEHRQLQQYDQAMQQVQEMQQQQYEKEMLKTLGSQRPQILNNKQQLQKVREETGAN